MRMPRRCAEVTDLGLLRARRQPPGFEIKDPGLRLESGCTYNSNVADRALLVRRNSQQFRRRPGLWRFMQFYFHVWSEEIRNESNSLDGKLSASCGAEPELYSTGPGPGCRGRGRRPAEIYDGGVQFLPGRRR